jgi:hypothetical protein
VEKFRRFNLLTINKIGPSGHLPDEKGRSSQVPTIAWQLAPKLIVLLLALMGANQAYSKPIGIKESEFLFSCRPSCERDAVKLGLWPLTAKNRCNCYCRTIFREMSDADISYFMQYRGHSENIKSIQAAAINACILKD